jgi:cytochrome c biogenesis protein CcdA/thiol-disulfide isomerase/thioredoxin
MLVLLAFAFLAGLMTVLSPCTLPILPILLSAGSAGSLKRPLGIVLGLVLSFTIFILGFSVLIESIGLSPNFFRHAAVIIIAFSGLILLFPSLARLFAGPASGVAELGTKIQKQSAKTSGEFWKGMIIGCALGLVWTPCAGPILAAIASLAAVNLISSQLVFITACYSLGAALPMFLIIYGSQKLIFHSRLLSSYTEVIRRVFGVLTIMTAIFIATGLDIEFEQMYLTKLPILQPDNIPLVKEELYNLKSSDSTRFITQAPEISGISAWINSAPLSIKNLKGKVILIDFWTYSCINCLRTLPYLKDWYQKYGDKGFVIIGVHTPEFQFEKDKSNVEIAVKKLNLLYPIALDNSYYTWEAYGNSFWPAHYLIDQTGVIRQIHFGEGGYTETENEIRNLLGLSPLVEKSIAPPITKWISPETYLGHLRSNSYSPEINILYDQTQQYNYNKSLELNQVGLKGSWIVGPESITAQGADSTLNLKFFAADVYLVLGGNSNEPITVTVDGEPLKKEYYTKDMDAYGRIFVKEPRKYDILQLQDNKSHLLSLHIPQGIAAYAFTFGND